MLDVVPETDTGLAINVLRILLRLTQKDLAKAIGIGTSSISDWETGKVIPREASVDRVLSGMNLTPAALERTLQYIQQMRAEIQGEVYPTAVASPIDQVRETAPRPVMHETVARSEVDAMTRSASELIRRFLESHFAALEHLSPSAGE